MLKSKLVKCLERLFLKINSNKKFIEGDMDRKELRNGILKPLSFWHHRVQGIRRKYEEEFEKTFQLAIEEIHGFLKDYETTPPTPPVSTVADIPAPMTQERHKKCPMGLGWCGAFEFAQRNIAWINYHDFTSHLRDFHIRFPERALRPGKKNYYINEEKMIEYYASFEGGERFPEQHKNLKAWRALNEERQRTAHS